MTAESVEHLPTELKVVGSCLSHAYHRGCIPCLLSWNGYHVHVTDERKVLGHNVSHIIPFCTLL